MQKWEVRKGIMY